jgi:predicted Zn-dependent protease
VKRRRFLAGGCAACAALWARFASAQDDWHMPARFTRPDTATDEGGLWAMMDRQEARTRRSPFVLGDAKLHAYITQIACRLAGEHCPDMRVYLLRTPLFNASMAPNGMMQVWTGLLLRMDNEAQLAAVLGHEIGHYLQRHSIERLRDAKSRSAFGQFLGAFGVLGAIGQVGVLASMFAYGREHELQADQIGVTLMHRIGYDTAEAAKVWQNLLLEQKQRPDGGQANPLFATHPPSDDRMQALVQVAQASPGGTANEAPWQESVKPFVHEWLSEEVKRGQHEESIALLTRLATRSPKAAEYLWARGEVYRLRAKDADIDLALKDFQNAVAVGSEPPETHRGLGYIYRTRNDATEARASFQRYLEAAPQAPDSAMIKSYLEELRT